MEARTVIIDPLCEYVVLIASLVQEDVEGQPGRFKTLENSLNPAMSIFVYSSCSLNSPTFFMKMKMAMIPMMRYAARVNQMNSGRP